MLTDYTKATFPLDTFTTEGHPVRLLGAHAGKAIGYVWWAAGEDHDKAYAVHAREWDGQGIYSEAHPSLNLIPPPGDIAAALASLEAELTQCQSRLDSAPSAPKEWRAVDEKRIAEIKEAMAKFTPKPTAE